MRLGVVAVRLLKNSINVRSKVSHWWHCRAVHSSNADEYFKAFQRLRARNLACVSFLIQDAPFESNRVAETGALRIAVKPAFPPIKRDTKSNGDLSELLVAVALTRAGYAVSKPLGENQRYDFIADDGERLFRVQVKTGRLRRGVVMFNCCSTHGHRRSGSLMTRSYMGQIELLAVYCFENQKVYLLPEADLTRTKIQLRLVAPRNNMTKTIRWASKYELA